MKIRFSPLDVLHVGLLVAMLLTITDSSLYSIVTSALIGVLSAKSILRRWLRNRRKQPIAAGDMVRLKSGGPLMVAKEYLDGIGWECLWFDEQEKCQMRYFVTEVLCRR